jgi:hypothetical protein
MPDVSALKFVYSDYRVLTASSSQAEYVYRANSLFDPDQAGAGGQPDGFDQWKALYGVYRVVAVKVEVQAVGNGASANGLLAVAPVDSTSALLSAEEVAGLRRGMATQFSPTQIGKLKATWHIGDLLGRSDQAVLADPNASAAVTTNPTTQYYILVAIESGNSATGQTMVWTKLTYYARMEVPFATLDSARLHRARFAGGMSPAPRRQTTARSAGVICDTQDDPALKEADSSTSKAVVATAPPVIKSSALPMSITDEELAIVLALRSRASCLPPASIVPGV